MLSHFLANPVFCSDVRLERGGEESEGGGGEEGGGKGDEDPEGDEECWLADQRYIDSCCATS